MFSRRLSAAAVVAPLPLSAAELVQFPTSGEKPKQKNRHENPKTRRENVGQVRTRVLLALRVRRAAAAAVVVVVARVVRVGPHGVHTENVARSNRPTAAGVCARRSPAAGKSTAAARDTQCLAVVRRSAAFGLQNPTCGPLFNLCCFFPPPVRSRFRR